VSSFVLLPEEVPKGFLEGYTPVAALLVLFQAFHGLAVTLVYKYADAIVKNFANATVMALLVSLSAAFFNLKVNAHSWLGIGIILTSTHLYMNIAIRR
jgi:UDP-sugar transporter A1/2/3